MRFSKSFGAGLVFLALSASASACTFSWHHYGADQTYKRLQGSIGKSVTDEYCNKYNKTHEIVVITDSYVNEKRTLAHVIVGLRKRGENNMPAKRFSSYNFEDGNFVVGKGYELAAALAVDTVKDVMSDMDHYAR